MAPIRVLVAGDVNGQVAKLYKRVANIQKKSGDFDVLLCTGSFFGVDGSADDAWPKYASGELQVPITTYILGPTSDAQKPRYSKAQRGGDLCENVMYLGQQGVYVMPNGLKLAYLSGVYDPKTHGLEDQPEPRVGYSRADVDVLVNFAERPSYTGVDVFLTSKWPSSVCNGAPVQPSDPRAAGSIDPGAAAAAKALRPRYHLASGGPGVYFERAPYCNNIPGLPPRNITRFFGLGAVGNASKEKWLYAFNCEPMSKLEVAEVVGQRPTETTANPYDTGSGIQGGAKRPTTNSFFFGEQRSGGAGGGPHKRRRQDNAYGGGGGGPSNSHGGVPRQGPRPPTGPCWFCLGGPDVEKHLVTSIGKQVYLALAKGGLTADHVMILPIQHFPSSLALEEGDILQEIDAYKTALREFYKIQGKACVIWERNVRSQHLQLQVCPIPEDKAAEVAEAMREHGQSLAPNFKWEVLDNDTTGVRDEFCDSAGGKDPPYFHAMLPDGTQMLHRADRGFPLQFGRAVIAGPRILNAPDRVDWKQCKVEKDIEVGYAKDFRAAFKPFDPSLKKP